MRQQTICCWRHLQKFARQSSLLVGLPWFNHNNSNVMVAMMVYNPINHIYLDIRKTPNDVFNQIDLWVYWGLTEADGMTTYKHIDIYVNFPVILGPTWYKVFPVISLRPFRRVPVQIVHPYVSNHFWHNHSPSVYSPFCKFSDQTAHGRQMNRNKRSSNIKLAIAHRYFTIDWYLNYMSWP